MYFHHFVRWILNILLMILQTKALIITTLMPFTEMIKDKDDPGDELREREREKSEGKRGHSTASGLMFFAQDRTEQKR